VVLVAGPAGPTDRRRDQVIYYQYKVDRARPTLRGTDEQVAKAEKAAAGKTPVKRTGSSSWPALAAITYARPLAH